MNFDFLLFKLINNLVGRNLWLDWLGIFCAKYLIWVLAVIVLSLFIFGKDNQGKFKNRIIVIKAFLAGGLAYLLSWLIGVFYFRPRPFVELVINQLIEKSSLERSFPSGHTIFAFALAFLVFFYRRRLGLILIFLALLIGLARVYAGVHWPLDVAGGIFLAFLVAFLIKGLRK